MPRPQKSETTTATPETAGARKPRMKGAPAGQASAERPSRGARATRRAKSPQGQARAPEDESKHDANDGGDAEEHVEVDEADAEFEPQEPEEDGAGEADLGLSSLPPTTDDDKSLAPYDPLAAYLREVQRHPLLSPEETHALAVQFVDTKDPRLAARMVTANLRLVVKIAYEYRRAYRNILDLVQEGNIGLMQAVKRYDPYRNVRLSSYAAWWIRAYILRFILNNWRLVKLGTTQAQRKLFFNLQKKRAELAAHGIDPTDAEVAKALDVTETDVRDMDVRLSSSEKSLDSPVGDSEGRSVTRVELMPSPGDAPDVLMAGGELQSLLREHLDEFRSTLEGKSKDLVIFDERLLADEPRTLQELGDRWGISRERVRQLEQRLTAKLRQFLRDKLGDAVTEV